ncbi:MAG: hypothetical protein AAGL29_02230 [Bacteroidota bacterium]
MASKKSWFKKIDPNLIIALGVLLTSFAALFVYVRQTNIMSEQSRILLEQTKSNAWPHLSLDMWVGDRNGKIVTYKFIVQNKGIGPALIESVKISYDGTYVENWAEFYEALQVPDSIVISQSTHNIHARVLAANESMSVIDWSTSEGINDNTDLAMFIFDRGDKIKMEICYQSIHGDTWKVTRHGFQSDLEELVRIQLKECENRKEQKLFLQ